MVTLTDIDVALARAEHLAGRDLTPIEQQEILTCLDNARGMLRELGRDSIAALERMSDSLVALSDITQGR